jgi:hypothetical protein
MKKITHYKLLCGSQAEIITWVNELIAEGWQPLGSANPSSVSGFLYQTLVKYHPTDNV